MLQVKLTHFHFLGLIKLCLSSYLLDLYLFMATNLYIKRKHTSKQFHAAQKTTTKKMNIPSISTKKETL